MPSPDELRAAIAAGRDAFQSALSDVAASWEAQPPVPEGEEAWSPRQVAEHAIPLEVHFATRVCEACGYPGVTWEGETSFADAAAASAALEQAITISNGRLKYVSDT